MEGVKLKPNDRIIFGTHSAFLFKYPEYESEAELEDTEENPITWESA